jgi:hypothetical protein
VIGGDGVTLKDYSTAQHLVGFIEGLGWALPENYQEAFFTAVENLTELLDKEVNADG